MGRERRLAGAEAGGNCGGPMHGRGREMARFAAYVSARHIITLYGATQALPLPIQSHGKKRRKHRIEILSAVRVHRTMSGGGGSC